MDSKWLNSHLPRRWGIKQDLAKALGAGSATVTRILAGDRQIKPAEVPIILQFLADEGVDEAAKALETPYVSPAMQRLMDQLAQLSDEELDFLTTVAGALPARRSQGDT